LALQVVFEFFFRFSGNLFTVLLLSRGLNGEYPTCYRQTCTGNVKSKDDAGTPSPRFGLKGKTKMFNAIRRKDRELNRTETESILVKGTYGVLSMNGENDYAYGVPLSYVYTGNSIYLHCAAEGRKITRIRNDNRVSFCVVGEAIPLVDQFSMKYESAIVFGKTYEVDQEEKLKALILIVEKYSTGEYLEKGKAYALNSLHKTAVIRVDIELISGKARR